ncbi:MAG TPA: hypothetical protein PKL31_00375 [Fulvivirga sp.]|nr:hypothetical protein [Fulvivirga sp.]
MSNMSDEHIDQHFKAAAEGAQFPFDESAWASLEKRISGSGFSYYQVIGTVLIGLILMVGTSIYLLEPLPQTKGANNGSEVAKNDVMDQIDPANTIEKAAKSEAETARSGQLTSPINEENLPKTSLEKEGSTLKNKANNQPITNYKQNEDTKALKKPFVPIRQYDQSNELLTRLGSDLGLSHNNPLTKIGFSTVEAVMTQDVTLSKKSPWAFKVQYAPDISSVGYFKGGKVGSNWGFGLEYKIANKWRLSTGVILSKKLYYTDKQLTSYGFYGNGATDIQRLDANCQVLDIPINIIYEVFSHKSSGFYVATGFSSYIMLSEDYLYKTSGNDWEQNYTNKNSHLFSIINFSLGYEHSIGRNTAIQLEPFIKAPIAGIGEGKVDLVSSGLFINLMYQLNKRSK